MGAITATTYDTPAPQASLGRARLEQARREADQAEAFARQMRSAADQAEVEAQKGQEKVNTLRIQVTQSDGTYTSQVKKKTAPAEPSSTPAAQTTLASISTVASNGFSFPENPLKAYSKASSLGGLGMKISGTIVNQTA
jgi:hypothetical protein